MVEKGQKALKTSLKFQVAEDQGGCVGNAHSLGV